MVPMENEINDKKYNNNNSIENIQFSASLFLWFPKNTILTYGWRLNAI